QQPYQKQHRGYVLQESHASEPIRRSRHERWISLERWWSPPKVTFTSKSVRFSAAHRPALLLAGKAPTRPSTVFPLKNENAARAPTGGASWSSAPASARRGSRARASHRVSLRAAATAHWRERR